MENKHRELLKDVIKGVRQDMTDEEIIHLILNNKLSKIDKQQETFGIKAADTFARIAGSWGFIIAFILILAGWITINTIFFIKKPFDSYPFILLNLVLSCLAAIQAPLIMMSQNRQEQKDRERAENDYKVNLKTEIIIEDIHHKLDTILHKQKQIEEKLTTNNKII